MLRALGPRHSKTSGQSRVPLLAKLTLLGIGLLALWSLAVSSPELPTEEVDEEFAAGGAEAPAAPETSAEQPAPSAPTAPAPAPEPEPAEVTERSEAVDPPPAAPDLQRPDLQAVLPQRQGPVDELSKAFAGESRGEGSAPEEARVKEAFLDPQIPSALLHSVECRRSVCRLELRWSPERDQGYVLGLTKAVGSFSAPLGIEAPGAADAQGQRPLVVFFGLSR